MHHARRQYSLDDYSAVEEMSEIRHEYFDGEIFAMSGGSLNHNQIAQNVTRAFDPLRERGYRSFLAGVRLKTPAGLYAYPDVMVICASVAFTLDRLQTVTNPVVIAEVLSASTREYDRGQKFDLYRTLPSLRDYLLVDQYGVGIEHRFLDRGEWQSQSFASTDDSLRLTGVPVTLRVADVYDLVEW